MKELVFTITATLLAGCIVSILHEMSKTFYFCCKSDKDKKKDLKNILHVWHYIDPIGLLFCVISRAGFSKSYKVQIRTKKLSRELSYVGSMTLILLFFISILILRFVFQFDEQMRFTQRPSLIYEFLAYLVLEIGLLSLGVFFTNLMPLTFTNIGFLIASQSSMSLLKLINHDHRNKVILIFILASGIIPRFCNGIFIICMHLV